MSEFLKFKDLSPTDYADGLKRNQFMDMGIKALFSDMPRIAGPAFTVQLSPGDNLMLHAAIYDAPKGSILVVDACDTDFAVAGGNVCGIAQKRGIIGFVIDGVIRDIREIKELRFPVFARGVIPIPGKKGVVSPLNVPVSCGGVWVSPEDIIIADEEGIAVIPFNDKEAVYEKAKMRHDTDLNTTLDEWEIAHRQKINALLKKK